MRVLRWYTYNASSPNEEFIMRIDWLTITVKPNGMGVLVALWLSHWVGVLDKVNYTA